MKRARWLVGLSLLAACGGRSIVTEPEGGGGAQVGTPSVSAGSGGKPGSTPPTAYDLPECEPGFDRDKQPERQCNWLIESNQCFDEHDAACACACPRDRESVCSSSFYGGPGSATRVRCF